MYDFLNALTFCFYGFVCLNGTISVLTFNAKTVTLAFHKEFILSFQVYP